MPLESEGPIPKLVRIYLDNCSFNRPYDSQTIKVKLETEAKLYAQELVAKGELDLVWSYALDYENSKNPFEEKKSRIGMWKQYAVEDIKETEIEGFSENQAQRLIDGMNDSSIS